METIDPNAVGQPLQRRQPRPGHGPIAITPEIPTAGACPPLSRASDRGNSPPRLDGCPWRFVADPFM